MLKNQMRFEIKEISEDGSFEGLLSPYGTVDLGGDVVEPGAYTKTLREHGNVIPMLWQHKADFPIGSLIVEDRTDGLYCKGQLLLEVPKAKEAYALIKAKIVKGLSIGYDSIKDSVESGIRHLKEIRLWEGSVVTFQMAPSALISRVKAALASRATKGDFSEELTEIQLQDASYQMQRALCYALGSLVWASGMTRDEKVSASAEIIQQFAEAFAAYFPAYLDLLAEMYGDMETMSKKRLEQKAGAVLSAANKQKLSTMREHAKSIDDILAALLDDEAGEDDATSKSAAAAVETKSEPVGDHSAIAVKIQELRGAFQWTQSNNS